MRMMMSNFRTQPYGFWPTETYNFGRASEGVWCALASLNFASSLNSYYLNTTV